MRIVQLANFYGPRSGGLRTFVDEVGRRYGAAGHQRILVVPGVRDADEVTPAGRRISLRGWTLPFDRGYRAVLSGRRVLGLLDELRPDALEVSDRLLLAHTSGWARARGVPVLLFAHERLDAALRDRVPGWGSRSRTAPMSSTGGSPPRPTKSSWDPSSPPPSSAGSAPTPRSSG